MNVIASILSMPVLTTVIKRENIILVRILIITLLLSIVTVRWLQQSSSSSRANIRGRSGSSCRGGCRRSGSSSRNRRSNNSRSDKAVPITSIVMCRIHCR